MALAVEVVLNFNTNKQRKKSFQISFANASNAEMSKILQPYINRFFFFGGGGRAGEGGYLFTTQSRLLKILEMEPFENILGNGENAGDQHFLLYPQCFLSVLKRISVFKFHLSFRYSISTFSP